MTSLLHQNDSGEGKTNLISQQIHMVERLRRWIHVWLMENIEFKIPPEIELKNQLFRNLGLHAKTIAPFLKDLQEYLGYSLRDDILDNFSNIESFCWRIVRNEPIAIVGMSCRFPGADSIEEFWHLLKEGESGISDASERWDLSTFYNPDISCPGTICSKWGGFIKNVEAFDAKFFRMSPREAAQLDPRQRIMLELSWEALEDAGIPPLELKGTKTGVYVATLTQDFQELLFMNLNRVDGYSAVGVANSIVANRISYALNLNGPSLAVDTACSGGLVAIKLAAEYLRNSDSPLAIVGGIMLNLIPDTTVFFTKAGALSVNGRCKSFDDEADGIVRSDGAGVIVLKRLSNAIRDKNVIHAIIRGGDINNDGQTKGIMQPSQHAQEILLRDAYYDSDISPLQVQYIEAHGTGTKVGDPIEMNAIANIIGAGRRKDNRCMLGSVKTNVGHMEAAAGFGGIIKTVLAMRHRQIPKVVHFSKLNSAANIEERHIHVQEELGPWPNDEKALIAGISSFGFGGTNAHIVIEEPMKKRPLFFVDSSENQRVDITKPPFHFFTLSARSNGALKHLAEAMLTPVKSDNTTIEDICYSLNRKRSHLENRLAIAIADKNELIEKLSPLIEEQDHSDVFKNDFDSNDNTKLAMVFSGQGSHWPKMGKSLFKSYAVFREQMQKCDEVMRNIAGFSLIEKIFQSDEISVLDATEIAQLSIFAIQTSLASLWESLGVVPDVVVGHSLGEISAAYVAGSIGLKDAATIVFHRSQLMKTTEGQGKTLAVAIAADKMHAYLKGFEDKISIAGSNSPTSSVLSGDCTAIEKIRHEFEEKRIFCRLLEGVNIAFHSHQMEPLKQKLINDLTDIKPGPSKIPVFSTVTGKMIDTMTQDAEYWGDNLRRPFLFPEAFAAMIDHNVNLFLEVSPHPVLRMPMQQCLKHFNHSGFVFSTLRKNCDENRYVMDTLCKLYTHGYNPDWIRLTPDGKLIALPKYPWQRERYWYDQLNVTGKGLNSKIALGALEVSGIQNERHPLLGSLFTPALSTTKAYWKHSMTANSPFFIKDHKVSGSVIAPGAAYLEMVITAAKEFFGKENVQLCDVSFKRAMPLREDRARDIQLSFDRKTDQTADFHICSREQGSHADTVWTVHAEGMVGILTTKPQDKMSLENVEKRFSKKIHAEEHYKKMKELGFEYGGCFQSVELISISAEELLGYFKVPDAMGEETRFTLNPVLMDAALQSVIQILLHMKGDEAELDGMYLPGGVENLKSYAKTDKAVWCLVKLISRPDQNEDNCYRADIRLTNDIGESIMEGYGFKFMQVNKISVFPQVDIFDMFATPLWQKLEDIKEDIAVPSTDALHVLFADREGSANELEQALKNKNLPCVKVLPKNEGRADQEILQIDPENKNDLHELVQMLARKAAESGLTSCNYIFMWGIQEHFAGGVNKELFTRFHSQVSIPLLYLVKSLSSLNSEIKHKLWVITREGFQVSGTEDIHLAASLLGMGNVIFNEHADLWGGWIDIDAQKTEMLTKRIIQYLNDGFPNEKHLAIRNSNILAQRLVRQTFERSLNGLRFRSNATYLITGGFGGLGSLVVRWMVENGAAHVLLIGRSAVPPRTQWNNTDQFTAKIKRNINTIQELESLGASVHTISADISDQETLFTHLRDFEAENRPEIKGVIHTAGILRDRLILNMEAEDILDVTLPKILGAWNLHEFFKNKKLEFFHLFSSVSSIAGMIGQANYAMGNAFMDALAHYRNQNDLVGCSINWGPWAEVGMASTANLGEQHSSQGIQALNNDEGIQALSILTQLNPTQATAAWVQWNRLKKFYPIGKSNFFSRIEDRHTAVETNGDADADFFYNFILMEEEERCDYVSSKARSVIAKILGLSSDQLPLDANLNDLGLDSIAAVQIQAAVEAQFGIEIKIFDLLKRISIDELSLKITSEILESDMVTTILDEIEISAESLDIEEESVSASESENIIR